MFDRQPFRRWFSLVGTAVTFALLGAGCSAQMPKTYPVQGTVLFDGKPVTKGLVRFQPLAEPSLYTVAEIQPDGRFVLTTHKEKQKASGAIEGLHEVTIVLPGEGGAPGGKNAREFRLPQSQLVEPGPNEMTLRISP